MTVKGASERPDPQAKRVALNTCLCRTRIRLVIENTSRLCVNFVRLTFTDSLTDATEAYVKDNDLSAAAAYEAQADARYRPVFRWLDSEDITIEPGHCRILEVECLGKLGW
jgi:hypothetical protein